jgi:hypothetical protein
LPSHGGVSSDRSPAERLSAPVTPPRLFPEIYPEIEVLSWKVAANNKWHWQKATNVWHSADQ